VNAHERFSPLIREKTTYMVSNMPLTFLFCGLPGIYHIVSVQYQTNKVYIVTVPRNTSVSLFAQGFSTLDQAFLYGGVVFVSTILEQIINTRISNFCIVDKNDIVQIASVIGKVAISVDDKAASALNLSQGTHTLGSEQLAEFLKPSVSGYDDSYARQLLVIRSFFDALRQRNIVLTALLVDQILTYIETNFTGSEVMKHYKNFTQRRNWDLVTMQLPVKKVQTSQGVSLEPEVEKTRTILSGN
jgi:anionic cell wall polymer biosynthesis LytR-Cps2A-Psr (LCP) family protein